MKSLAIALLLTVSVCVGQNKAYRDSSSIGTSVYSRYPYSQRTITTFEDLYNARLEDFATIFVILWDEYAKECWADSIYGFIHHPDKTCWYSLGNKCMAEGHWRQEWIHPTKPTPEGFVEFLRRKTK